VLGAVFAIVVAVDVEILVYDNVVVNIDDVIVIMLFLLL
jgi:hypothetical protein